MSKVYLLSAALALMIASTNLERADAIPLVSHGLTTAAPKSSAQPVYYRRGYYAGGGYRYGGRYYGGVWYGQARRWYGGRWWPYGVGRCWAPSPIGFVWICG
jgi:hypothetical protein